MYASVVNVWFLLQQGLAFRDHDESEDSRNQGNFLELLQLLANHNSEIKVVTLQNASENLKLTSPNVHNDITNGFASEIVNVTMKDIGTHYFLF